MKFDSVVRSFVIVAMAGLVLLYLFGWIMSLFGVDAAFWARPTSFGIFFSIVVVGLAGGDRESRRRLRPSALAVRREVKLMPSWPNTWQNRMVPRRCWRPRRKATSG